ncbi:MAG TPA: phosphoribosylanthranilate isomerase [Thermodesulfobacteriota bacterium]|jgi:phosphoribosylanthranilate isomerase|nr:phosphoribosylanthranilate isomerase [Thermodesulfobacteriota bacterium]
MTKIKICGITSTEDALLAADLGADAVGFVFYRESKRYIRPEKASEIVSKLPPFVITVGVFVNQGLDEIKGIKEEVGFDTIQLHGDESPLFCSCLNGKVIKAIRVREGIDPREVEAYQVQAILFDAYSTRGYGGTGESFRWDIIRGLNTSKRIIISGGLTPENVSHAIRITNPYAVDVSSGVEEYPGRKSPERLKKFIEAVRR